MAVAKLQIALVSLVLLTQCAVRCQDELRVEWTVSGVAQYANASLQVPLGYTVIFDCQNNSFSNVIYQYAIYELHHQEGETSYELWFTIEVDRQPADLTIKADIQQQNSCNTSVTSGSHMKVGECRGNPSEIRQEVTQNSGMLPGTVHYEPGRIYYFTSYSDGTLAGSITRESLGGECLDGLKMAFEVLNATQIPDNNNEVSTLGDSVSVVIAATPTPGATPVSPSEGGVQVPPLTTVHIAIIGAAGGVVIVIIVILLVVVCCICAKKGRSNKVKVPNEMEMKKDDVVIAIAVENGVSDKLPLSTQSKNHQEKPATQRAPSKQSKPPVVESNQGAKQSQIKKQPSQLPNNASAQSRSTAQAVSNTPKGGTKSQESKVERGGTRARLRKGGSTDPSTAPSKSNKTASRTPTSQTQGLPPLGQRGTAPPTQSLPPLRETTKEDTDTSKSSNQKKQSGTRAQRTAPGMKKASSVGNESNHPPVSKTMSDSSSPRRSSVTPRRPAPGIPMQRSQTVTGKPPSHDNMRKKNNSTTAVLNTSSSR